MNDLDNFCASFIKFLHKSPTPFHATENLCDILQNSGFSRLDESLEWQLQKGGRYYFTRSGSTLLAFIVGENSAAEAGVRMVGAHTDSPCLKVKPQPEKNTKTYQQLGIEVYGGALLNPWFDRDLSLAGKVCYLDVNDRLETALVDFEAPIAVIPSLAIHLDREANKKRSINPQTDMNPILYQCEENFSLREMLFEKLRIDGSKNVKEVLDFDLSFYDVQAPALVGYKKEFLAGARLDNLLSSFVGIRALAETDSKFSAVMVCNDHEEIGSRTDLGAQGTALQDLLMRLYPAPENCQIAIRSSLLLSVDNAHGVHPNFLSKHDDNHGPIINQGPVLKFDANQSYATSATTSARVKQLARLSPEVPLQCFVTRADMRCGSTIGPLTAAGIGIKTLDLGVPTFAMHSVRELAGKQDVGYLHQLLARFYTSDEVSLRG